MQKFEVWKKRNLKKALQKKKTNFAWFSRLLHLNVWQKLIWMLYACRKCLRGIISWSEKDAKRCVHGVPLLFATCGWNGCLNPEVLAMKRKLLASYHQIGGLQSSWTLGVGDRTSPCTGFWLEACLRKGVVVSQESRRRKAVSRLRSTLEVSDMVTRHMPFWKAASKLAEELLHKSDCPCVYHEVVSQLIWQTGERSFRKNSLQEKSC